MENANAREMEKLEKRLNRELEQLQESDPVKQLASLEVMRDRIVSLKTCWNLPMKFLRSYTLKLLKCQANLTVPHNKKLLENVLSDLQILLIAGGQRENAANMKYLMSIHDDSVEAMLKTQAFIQNAYENVLAEDRAKQEENAQKKEVGVKKKNKFMGLRVRLTPYMKKCISIHKQRRKEAKAILKQRRKEAKLIEKRRRGVLETLNFYRNFFESTLICAPALPILTFEDLKEALPLCTKNVKKFTGVFTLIKPCLILMNEIAAVERACQQREEEIDWQVVNLIPSNPKSLLETGFLSLEDERTLLPPGLRIVMTEGNKLELQENPEFQKASSSGTQKVGQERKGRK